jgi:hypothetical protein
MNAIALAIQSAIILGESIFWEWRSFFVMTRGDHFGRVNFSGIAIIFCDDEGRSFWESQFFGNGDHFL